MKKAVIVGCGKSGEKIAAAVEMIRDKVEIAGVCDLNIARAQKVGGVFSAAAYSDYRKMLDELQPEIAFVAVPPYCTDEILDCAAENKISFMTESPVSLSCERCCEIIEKIRENGILTAVKNPLLPSKLMRVAKQFADKNPVIRAEAEYVTPPPDMFWKRDEELSGGILLEKGMFLLECLSFLFGDVSSSHLYTQRGFVSGIADYNTDDLLCADMMFECGTCASMILGNYASDSKGALLTMYSFGKRLVLREDEVRIYGESFDPGKTKKMLRGGEILPDFVDEDCLVYKNDENITPESAFAAAVETGKADFMLPDYKSGVKSLKTALELRKGKPE